MNSPRVKYLLRSIALVVVLAFSMCQFPLSTLALSSGEEIAQTNQEIAESVEIVREDVTKREESVKHFLLNDGSYIAVQYETPIHYLESDTWVEYDNTMTAISDAELGESFQNQKADYAVRIAKKTNGKKWVRLDKDGHTISWYYDDAAKVSGVVQANQEDDSPLTLENTSSVVTFADIYENVDLRLRVSSSGLKEDLVLKENGTRTSFTLHYDIGKLHAKQTTPQTIELQDDAGNVVYTLDAPYMTDADGQVSTAMTYRIVDTKNKRITVELSADAKWLSQSNRNYPVVVDPTVSTQGQPQLVDRTFVSSKYPTTPYGADCGVLRVGYSSNYGNTRTLLSSTFPELGTGDTMIGAWYHLVPAENSQQGTMTAYPLDYIFDPSTAVWSDATSYDTTALDRVDVDPSDDNAEVLVDVTGAAHRYYNENIPHFGIVLVGDGESQTTNSSLLFENDSASTGTYPYMVVQYRNAVGLEDYYTYVGTGAGRGGSADVNIMSGNLVVTQSLTTSDESTVMPVTVSLVYNAVEGSLTTPHSQVGQGWRTNYHLRLMSEGNGSYYTYTDSDGTRHTFSATEETGKFVDEDGMGYTLAIGDTVDTVTDMQDSAMVFDKTGRLQSIQDALGNTSSISYTELSNGNDRIHTITDGLGRVHTFRYQSNSTTVITGIEDVFGRVTTLQYTGNKLTGITYPDNRQVTFAYTTGELLGSVIGNDGLETAITYNTTGRRVEVLKRHNPNAETNGVASCDTFEYDSFCTYVTGDDGHTVSYQYNNYGQTTGVVSHRTGTAQFYQYHRGNTKDRTANRILSSSRTQSSVTNLIVNPRLDESAYGYTVAQSGNSNRTFAWDGSRGNTGKGSLKISRTGTPSSGGDYAFYTQSLVAERSAYYTFSAYINTDGAVIPDNGAEVRIERWKNGTYIDGRYYRVVQTAENEWERAAITVACEAGETVKCLVGMEGAIATGTMYVDDLQLESKATVVNTHNVIENNNFVFGIVGWDSTSPLSTAELSPTELYGFDYAGKLTAAPTATDNRVGQTVRIDNGKAGDVYSLSGWAKGVAAPSQEFALCADFLNASGGVISTQTVDFNPLTSAWQMASVKLIAPENHAAVRVYYSRKNNIGDMLFAGLCLQREEYGITYTYDENGMPISSVDKAQKESAFAYNGSELIRQLNPSGSRYFYTYDDNHQITSAISSDSVAYMLEYDAQGNNTSARVSPMTPVTVPVTTHTYYLLNAETAKALTTTGTLSTYALGNSALQWELLSTENGLWKLSADTGELGVSNDTVSVGAVGQGTAFQLVPQTDSSVVLVQGPKCIAATQDSTAPQLTDYDASAVTASQKWYVFDTAEMDTLFIKTLATYTNGKVETSTDAFGQETRYEYSASNGLVSKVFDPKGQETSYTYEANSSRLRTVSVGGATITYNYDTADRITSLVAPNGQVYSFTYDAVGRNTAISVGTGTAAYTLSAMQYDNYGRLVSQDYANGSSFGFAYDDLDRLYSVTDEDEILQLLFYNADGDDGVVVDVKRQQLFRYVYDRSGRLVGEQMYAYATPSTVTGLGSAITMTEKLMSCTRLVTGAQYTFADTTDYLTKESFTTLMGNTTMSYTYGDVTQGQMPDTVYVVNGSNSLVGGKEEKVVYTYDALSRISSRTVYLDVAQNIKKTTTYEYMDGAHGTGSTSTRVRKETTDGITTEYTYDALGNISSVYKNGALYETYQYDAKNQLTRVTSGDGTYADYTYDANGNLLTETRNGTPYWNYTYGDTQWKDRLTSVGANTITYDASGNPLTYGGARYSWDGARNLVEVTVGEHEVDLAYASDGTRMSKTVNGVTTTYYYVGGRLYGEQTGNNKLIYLYDDTNVAYGYLYNDTAYYYEKNIQGDVIGLWHQNGNRIANYTYDVWGNITSITNQYGQSVADQPRHPANLNPLRYRGYYYDTETGLYYVSSRYYDPEIGRWISPEPNVYNGEFDEGAGLLSYNVYAYCVNNPVNNFDPDGEAVANIVGGVIGGVAGAALGALLAKELGLSGWKKALFIAGVTAAGAALGAFLGPYMAKLGGKIASMTKSAASSFKATVQSARTAIKHSKAVTKLINNASKLKRSKTVMGHLSSRPYTNSTLTIQNIMKAGKPMADSSLKNGLKWVVNGTYNGSSGVWELVVDTTTNTIVHFLFRSK